MAEVATIARPYAEALFKSSSQGAAAQAELASALTWLATLASIAADTQVLAFADNPKISAQQVYDLIAQVAGGTLSAPAGNFLRAVIDNGRLSALPEMAHQFRSLVNAQSGFSDAVVHSAFAIEGAALDDLKALLEQRFGRKLNLSVIEDKSLIGGVRVVVGDEVLDTSVKARLEQMRIALAA